MHFIEDRQQRALLRGFYGPCIRQNVCTSLRSVPTVHAAVAVRRLHTSKRMHFIEELPELSRRYLGNALAYVKTYALHWGNQFIDILVNRIGLAYVKTYALHWGYGHQYQVTGYECLHTSKRMHFIEEWLALTVSVLSRILAYVKTYALHWGSSTT